VHTLEKRPGLAEQPRPSLREIDERIRAWMSKVRHKVVVLSGKGGVGKSTIAANLAVALAWKGRPNLVGILDADITGPSIPKILGLRGRGYTVGPPGLFPVVGPLGVKVVSMDFLLPSDETPVIWRGPMKSMAIKQFLASIVWGELEYLLVDLPPGTGDEALTVLQSIPEVDGALIVTAPSDLSQLVVKKAVSFVRQLNIRVLGLVENMSGFVCPHCGQRVDVFSSGGGERIARDMGVPLLSKIPLDPRISEASDRGMPFIVEHSDSPAAKAFMDLVERLEELLEAKRP